MPTDHNEIERLAERIEAGTAEEQIDLITEAFRAISPKPTNIWVTDNAGPWTDEYSDWNDRQWRFFGMLEAEAWESAAMTLVPEPHSFAVGLDGSGAGASVFTSSMAMLKGAAATPALALTAACLRARAALKAKEQNDG
jgi:hypothetical protein